MWEPQWLASSNHLGDQLKHSDGALVMDKFGSAIRSLSTDAMVSSSAPTLANLVGLHTTTPC